MASQRRRPITGAEGLVGERGHAMTAITPEAGGQVSVHGEIWRARSATPVAAGEPVKVMALDGLTLLVQGASTALGGEQR
jgi:membrane-bound serine protease (ClpP class)